MAGNPGKISATNTFEGGLVADLNVMSSPSNTTIDALNMEIITIADNQNIYQNIKGNKKIVDLPKHSSGARYIPLGLQINDNIAYIICGAFTEGGDFISGMIGTFPSPNWTDLNNPTIRKSELFYTFAPLHNYKAIGQTTYTFPFESMLFNFERNRFIDVVIQGDYDSSVNVIFTDNLNNTLIINSRFNRTAAETTVELADRVGLKDSNIYSDDDWDRIALIQNTNFPVQVDSIEVKEGGYLFGGGYRYYFKYLTQEGNTTDILYESPLIPIANGGLGLDKTQTADKAVQFSLSGLDTSYTGIQVFFAHFDGLDTVQMEIFKINYVYNYASNNTIVITHTGLEDVEQVELSELNTVFTPIDTVRTLTIVNDRLAFGGVSSTLRELDILILQEAAKDLFIWEEDTKIYKDYSDPQTAATAVGLWPGEVYEFAAVFMLTNKGLSPAFPITGMDNYEKEQSDPNGLFINGAYPPHIIDEDGFSSTNLINNKGIFRTSIETTYYTPKCTGEPERNVRYVRIDSSALKDNKPLDGIVDGFFIVRRQRVKNVLMQGMMVPTLRLPDKHLSVAPYSSDKHRLFIAAARYLGRHSPFKYPTIGLNAPYTALTVGSPPDAMFNDDFYTTFVPQPTQGINVVTPDKAWNVTGSVAQDIDGTLFGDTVAYRNTVDKDGIDTKKFHMAFYSCEIDLNFPAIRGYLNGVNPAIEVMKEHRDRSPVGYTDIPDTEILTSNNSTALLPTYSSPSNLIIRHAEALDIVLDDLIEIDSKYVRASLMPSGVAIYANGAFTSKVDRSFGLTAETKGTPIFEGEDSTISFVNPFYPFKDRGGLHHKNYLSSTARVHIGSITTKFSGGDYQPYSLISHSYSSYIGFTIEKEDGVARTPEFQYLNKYANTPTDFSNSENIIQCTSGGSVTNTFYTNLGHVANVFRSATGRWSQLNIRDIFKFDSNAPYHAVTNRTSLTTASVDVFRGDGFISSIYKRITYKNGVPAAPGASQTDAALYGIGIIKEEDHDVSFENMPDLYKEDEGRNLFDNGQIIQLISYANINADIRSVEQVSAEDSALGGGDRNFYPNKEEMFGDQRPDSEAYNHGYTGDTFPLTYFRIEESSPVFSTSFPNRVLVSERNQTQSFFNSFRDIKGFNFRDYGIELGPIIKLVNLKGVLISVHTTGVIAIGVDDRTLLSEGSDIFINTAEALSPKAYTISDIYGSQHPEAMVKTDVTVIGVDYRLSSVWMFQGDKLNIISEFSVKTILDSFKATIEAGGFVSTENLTVYMPRVYSTYDKIKHTVFISYIAEHPTTREQFHVGTITYNLILQKWVSRIADGNKFGFMINAFNHTFGFDKNFYDKDAVIPGEPHGIWQEDTLTDAQGKEVRNTLRGNTFPYIFEIVVSDQPSLEKILDNMLVITNKVLPDTIIYTTSGDVNDPALNIWGAKAVNKITTQEIITRNEAPRINRRLRILDENAYYKNSGLYIEVAKIDSISRKAQGNRRVRDKNIKIRFVYKGTSPTFIQAIISTLSISYG